MTTGSTWRFGLMSILTVGFAAGAPPANIPQQPSGHSRLLANVQSELTRLGFDFVLEPLPMSTASHIYARPLWIADGHDELWSQLINQQEWQRDAGLFHRLGHPGSRIGFRQKRSPSLHISVYESSGTYIYEFHYDRFLSLGHSPISALKHIFAEVVPNAYFGKHTSQEHIGALLERRKLRDDRRSLETLR